MHFIQPDDDNIFEIDTIAPAQFVCVVVSITLGFFHVMEMTGLLEFINPGSSEECIVPAPHASNSRE